MIAAVPTAADHQRRGGRARERATAPPALERDPGDRDGDEEHRVEELLLRLAGQVEEQARQHEPDQQARPQSTRARGQLALRERRQQSTGRPRSRARGDSGATARAA
ncbi:MAG: hypothetical protein IPJ04_01960 [Candidatus Eisenbacteria bacterium]|nr:hypothetical protein [Candidatus Eisenbacteria bacterium]